MRRMLSLLLAVLFVVSLPLTALAVEVDLYYGDVTITDTDVTHSTATETNKTESHGGSVTVVQKGPESTGYTDDTSGADKAPTSNTVTVTTTTKDVTVTLDDVNIALQAGNIAQENPVDVNAANGTTVTIELDGNNKLDASTGTFENNGSAGLHKDESGNLVIQDSNKDGGSLTAIGNVYAAGIGSNYSYSGEKTANITIESGTVHAESKSPYSNQHSSGAGIGGGSNGAAENITINGGTVTTVADMGAAIGGGSAGTANDITITGGTVTATSTSGAGIGGGQGKSTSSSTGDEATAKNITISGGEVTATSTSGAGIGGGGAKGRGEEITISGNAVVNASSTSGAGIGGGSNGAGSGITIENGTVTATSNTGAGIGGGANTGGTGTDIVINDGTVNASSNAGAGIGSGSGAMHFNVPVDIAINGGNVTAESTDGAAIGGGKNATYYGSADNRVINVEITDGTVNATSTNGAAIGVGNGFSKPTTTNVAVSGDADVTATSTNGSAFGTDKEGNDIIPDTSELNGDITANQGGETVIYPLPVAPAPEAEAETSEQDYVSNPVAADENGNALEWTKDLDEDRCVITIAGEKKSVAFSFHKWFLNSLKRQGAEKLVVKTAVGEIELSIQELLDMSGNKYVLTFNGSEIVLTVDGEVKEI